MDNVGVFGSSKYDEEWRIAYVDEANFVKTKFTIFRHSSPPNTDARGEGGLATLDKPGLGEGWSENQ